ncbi:MAG: DUF1538 family protein [Planctomyces sp.]|nr:DUF1538 family protein [Planctomyces sp.]
MTASDLRPLMTRFAEPIWRSTRDLLPIVVTVAVFQLFVFQTPLENVGQIMSGLVLVIAGLTLFVEGLEAGLFQVGSQLGQDFAGRGSLPWLIAFAFALGFGPTFAEPALIAIANKAADRSPDRVNLYEIKAKPVLSVRPEMNIKYCARLLERFSLMRSCNQRR